MTEKENWQWVAGIYTGEGACVLVKGKYPSLRLSMTDQDVVEQFADVVGYGKVNYTHSPSKQKYGWKPTYVWSASKRKEVERIVENMAPYLFSKRLLKFEELELINREIKEIPRDWAWAGGLFSGEGCVSSSDPNRTGKRSPRLRLEMIDEDVVQEFYNIVGSGNIHFSYTPTQQRTGRQATYRWDTYRRSEIERICSEMYPYLGERRKEKIKELGII